MKRKTSKTFSPPGRTVLNIVQKYFPDVLEVNDATEDIHIAVTEKDDKKAFKMDHTGCAMAIAMKREMNLDGVIMSISTAYTIKGAVATRYSVPSRTGREIVSFDRGGHFDPGVYYLKPPIHRIGEDHGEREDDHDPPAVRRTLPHILTANIRTVLGGRDNG